MPRRSNRFQRLVRIIEEQLADEHVEVLESHEFKQQISAQWREIDVVVRDSSGAHPRAIGIECSSWKRPRSIEWVEQIYGKHQLISEISESILVSRSGFTRSAQTLAEALGMKAYSLEEAEIADWTTVVGLNRVIPLHRFAFTGIQSLTMYGDTHFSALSSEALEHLEFYDVEGHSIGSAVDVAELLTKHDAFINNFLLTHEWSSEVYHADARLDPPVTATDGNGQKYYVFRLVGVFKVHSSSTSIELTHSLYGPNVVVAHGYSDTPGVEAIVSLTENRNEAGANLTISLGGDSTHSPDQSTSS